MWVNSVIFINSHFYLGELLFEEISPTHLHQSISIYVFMKSEELRFRLRGELTAEQINELNTFDYLLMLCSLCWHQYQFLINNSSFQY